MGVVRTFRFVYQIALPARSGSETFRIWLPRPPNTPYQEILSAELNGPADVRDATDEQFGNKGYFLESPPSSAPTSIELSLLVTRKQRRSPPVNGYENADYGAGELDSPEARTLLAANLNVPTDGFIAYQARSIASAMDSPVQRARLIFHHLIETLDYDWAGCTPDRIAELGNLKKACDLRTGTCTEFHGLYVGYLRSLGVPAQFHFGFNVPNYATSGKIPGYHCWSEILLPGVGWFPVDVSEAWKQPEIRDFYFGGLDCDRIEFHVGRDLTLNPRQAGGPVDKWIFGHAERGGKPFPLDVSFRFEDVST